MTIRNIGASTTSVSEVILAAAQILFQTRTGEVRTNWETVPISTRERYVSEACTLHRAGLLGISDDIVRAIIAVIDSLALEASLSSASLSTLDSLRAIAEPARSEPSVL